MSTIALSRTSRLRCHAPSQGWTLRPSTVTVETLTSAAGRTGDHVWSILTGHAPSSGSSLRGAAGRYRSSYDRSVRAVLARLAAAGVPSRREARGRRTVLLLGSLAETCARYPMRDCHAPWGALAAIHAIRLLTCLGYSYQTPIVDHGDGLMTVRGDWWSTEGVVTHVAAIDLGTKPMPGYLYQRMLGVPAHYPVDTGARTDRIVGLLPGDTVEIHADPRSPCPHVTVYVGSDPCPHGVRGSLPTDRPVADLCQQVST